MINYSFLENFYFDAAASGSGTPHAAGSGTPLVAGSGTPPAASGSGTPPAASGSGTPPAASGTGTPPAASTGTPPAASGTGTPPAASGTGTPPAASGTGTPPAAIIYISDTKESCNKDKDCNYINCGNAETNETSHCIYNHCVKRLLSGEILDCPKKPDNISNETTNGIADKTLSVSAIIFISLFLIILILWIIAGLAAFIMSFICFGYNNEPGYVYLGILLALFFGPLYWIYYIYNKKYCY
jgi:hypothetical protein